MKISKEEKKHLQSRVVLLQDCRSCKGITVGNENRGNAEHSAGLSPL